MSRWAWLSTPLHNSQRSTIRGFHRGPHRHMDKRHLVAKRTNPDKRWRGRPKPKPWSGLNLVNKFNHVATVSRYQVTVKTWWLGQCSAGSLSILWTSWSGRQYAVPVLHTRSAMNSPDSTGYVPCNLTDSSERTIALLSGTKQFK